MSPRSPPFFGLHAEDFMQAGLLMVIFLLTAAVVQAISFGLSRLIDYQWPAAGMLTFLILFLCAYAVAWPIAVRITEWMIVKAGYKVQTANPDPR